MLVKEKSFRALANAFYPLWGTLRKEQRKPPPKALLFKAKLYGYLPGQIESGTRSTYHIDLDSRAFGKTLSKSHQVQSNKFLPRIAFEEARGEGGCKGGTSGQEEEEADVEVNLPLGTSLLHNKELAIRLIRQLFRDVDMALRKEKLLDIEREFKEVHASANDLAKEFQILDQMAKDGVKMFGELGSRYRMQKYSKATLKARYKLLKKYKQGLLVEGDVDEEIKLYEESLVEAEASTSATKSNVVPPAPAMSEPVIAEP
ncbi:hypothetical protein TIFTF001_033117 [Ficus carica]|uniref:Uncharacterized protein n=1 Tax=Ficus carica TaxID=3494 RepID=A0AA88J6Q3_FICCA|nr:hypothetical protein TIFTF001_033117 [Ficus carica]